MDAVKHMLEATHLRNEPQVDPDQDPVSQTMTCAMLFIQFTVY